MPPSILENAQKLVFALWESLRAKVIQNKTVWEYCLFALNKILDLWTAISQWKTMPIKNPATLLYKEFDSL